MLVREKKSYTAGLLCVVCVPFLSGAGPVDKVDTNTPEDIQRQQADLQAKILSLLGSSAVVPSSSGPPAKPGPHRPPDNYGLSSSHGGSAVSYPQQSHPNSSGYASSYGSSAEGNSGYGASYGGYNYR